MASVLGRCDDHPAIYTMSADGPAIKDPVIWVYLLLQISSFIIVNGLSTFANIIVRGLGFTPYQTQLLNCAQGGWSILVFVGSAWLARITNQTILVLIIFMREQVDLYVCLSGI